MSDDFRWQGFFQRSTEPLFLLNRQFHVLFVNQAFEELTSLSSEEANRLHCTLRHPPKTGETWSTVLRHVLCPPTEVRQGKSGHARRLVPAREGKPPCWWDVDYFPLGDEKGLRGLLAKITVGPAHDLTKGPPIPESLENLRHLRSQRWRLDQLIARVPRMKRVREQIRLASQFAHPVLLVGEPGTGKKMLARVIHGESENRDLAFVSLDCERFPIRTIESIVFRESNSAQEIGTVCLAHPERLPRETQLRLIESIQENALPHIIATSICPETDVEQETLLDELLQTLSVTRIEVPNLVERRDELPHLIDQMLEHWMEQDHRLITSLTADAWEIVLAYTWPGNLRELDRALRSARQHCEQDSIDANDLPGYVRQAFQLEQVPRGREEKSWKLREVLEKVERRMIEMAFGEAKGSRPRAAKLLSITADSLERRQIRLALREAKGDRAKAASLLSITLEQLERRMKDLNFKVH